MMFEMMIMMIILMTFMMVMNIVNLKILDKIIKINKKIQNNSFKLIQIIFKFNQLKNFDYEVYKAQNYIDEN